MQAASISPIGAAAFLGKMDTDSIVGMDMDLMDGRNGRSEQRVGMQVNLRPEPNVCVAIDHFT